MSDNLKVLQVSIASPNDLVDERRAIKEVADSLNAALRKEVGQGNNHENHLPRQISAT